MRTINNKYWENAVISDDSQIDEYNKPHNSALTPDFQYGIWFDGIWKNGDWWEGVWLCGYWETGRISPPNTLSYFNSNISPKSYYKPKRTLSLNYAHYQH